MLLPLLLTTVAVAADAFIIEIRIFFYLYITMTFTFTFNFHGFNPRKKTSCVYVCRFAKKRVPCNSRIGIVI